MLTDQLSQYLDYLTKAAAKAGPQVMQFAIQHEHWCGVGDVLIGGFCAVIAAIGFFILKKHWAIVVSGTDDEIIVAWTGVLGGIIGVVSGLAAAIILLNIWNWVAVFNPKIALFHDILEKLLSK